MTCTASPYASGLPTPLDAVTKHCKSAIPDGFAFCDSIGRTQKTTIIPYCEVKIKMEVIETGMVPIYQDEQRRVVNARELHVFLEVGRDFSNWIKGRIDKYGFVEGEDYVVCSPNLASKEGRGGHNAKDYILTIDTEKEVAMEENNQKGREVRR